MITVLESVLSDALEELQSTGTLSIEEWVERHPEYADELRDLLPVMVQVHQEKPWMLTREETRRDAIELYPLIREG